MTSQDNSGLTVPQEEKSAEMRKQSLSIILPAKEEAANLTSLLPQLIKTQPTAEIIVVNDGSTDATAAICKELGVRAISHPYSMGNGAAVKTGARHANGDILLFMDADGQHRFEDIPRLLEKLDQGYEMVVGARQSDTHASFFRRIANLTYNRLASLMTGHKIEDLTSGFRAARARHFRKFLYLLPNGFSYPTTSTMAFLRSGLPMAYVPIRAEKRGGKSHIRILKDGVRFFVIILKIGALFSPMRLFLPISSALFVVGSCYYAYTYVNWNSFTNMSALLFISSLLTFLIGIISEQISSLHYKGVDDTQRRVVRESQDNQMQDKEARSVSGR